MTLEKAKEIKQEYISIIGKTSTLNLTVLDVIVEPVGIDEAFRMSYVQSVRQNNNISNDLLLNQFKSDTYQVSAVLCRGSDLTTIVFDDILEYKSFIS